jgi:hypothetical protein
MKLPVLVLAGAFIGVRVVAYSLGLRFDASQAAAFWHFIEPELLRERLLESVFYLHSQPPLFNLWLGVYLKLCGDAMPIAFAVSFVALGVFLCVQMNALARIMGVPTWLRAIGIALFCTSPAVLLYENFLLYTYPVAALLTWSAVRFHRALESGRERDWFVCAAILAGLVLMRALYHPVWLVAVLGGAACALRAGNRRLLLRPALVAAVIVGAIVVKNQIIFGESSLSSFSGMNLSRVVLDRMDERELAAGVRSGRLSPWARTGGFVDLYQYDPLPAVPATGVPLLDRAYKADGSINFHHRAYIEISDQLARDSREVILADPGVYLRSVGQNLRQSLMPASTYAPLAGARTQLSPLVAVYEPLLGWIPFLGPMGVWPVLLPVVLCAATLLAWRERRASAPRAALLVYLAFNIVYVIAVGALMERSENQRFRFDVDPMIWVMVLGLVGRVGEWLVVPERREEDWQERVDLHGGARGGREPFLKSLGEQTVDKAAPARDHMHRHVP